jgi:MFS family permease
VPHPRRNVFLLACCQALLLANGVTLIAVNGLAGFALADNKALATLPATAYIVGAALSTFPLSLWMKRVGRRNGFFTGGAFGLAGSIIAAVAISIANFPLLCLGTFLLGFYNAAGQYYRFAAADAAPASFKARAISLVLAGGLVGGIVGPQLSKITIDLARPQFLATYASLFVYCTIAMAIVAFLAIPSSTEKPSGEPARALSKIVAQPVFVVAAGVAALGYSVMNLLMVSTPLAMSFCGYPYPAAAGVIAAHVVAMFGPSFFTGSLIQRFGVLNVMLAGTAAMFAAVSIALSGELVANFWWALVLLGIGWNFMYVGGTTLLTEAYAPSEKAKAQGFNEIVIFGVQALSSFASGVLVNTAGWRTLNYVSLPLLVLAAGAALWLLLRRRMAVVVS